MSVPYIPPAVQGGMLPQSSIGERLCAGATPRRHAPLHLRMRLWISGRLPPRRQVHSQSCQARRRRGGHVRARRDVSQGPPLRRPPHALRSQVLPARFQAGPRGGHRAIEGASKLRVLRRRRRAAGVLAVRAREVLRQRHVLREALGARAGGLAEGGLVGLGLGTGTFALARTRGGGRGAKTTRTANLRRMSREEIGATEHTNIRVTSKRFCDVIRRAFFVLTSPRLCRRRAPS
jgi:hypothetical protein